MDEQLTDLLAQYQPSDSAVQIVKKIKIVLLVGISGAGKNVIKNCLLVSEKYRDIITHTTRSPRKNGDNLERDGIDYHFISFAQAKTMLQNQEFIEAKLIHRKNIYGTSLSEFEACLSQNKIALADIDVQGVDEYMELAASNVKPIFLLPPSYKVWLERLKSRYEGNVSQAELLQRQQTAVQEIEHVLSKPYFSIIINDNLDEAADKVQAIAEGQPETNRATRQSVQLARQLLAEMKLSTH